MTVPPFLSIRNGRLCLGYSGCFLCGKENPMATNEERLMLCATCLTETVEKAMVDLKARAQKNEI